MDKNFDKKILKSKKFDKIFGTKFLEWINKIKRKKENLTRKV